MGWRAQAETRFLALLHVVLSGIAVGCIYALVALGFVLIYKATETVNFAQGEMMMLGAFAGFALVQLCGVPYLPAVVISVILVGCIGVAIERIAIRPILGQPQFSVLMLTIGLGYVARGAVTLTPALGADTHVLATPYKGQILHLGGVALGMDQLVVIAATAVLCALLYAMFRFTKIGIAMQASSQNQLAAYYMGIPVRGLNGLVWGLSAGVAAIAGLLLAPLTFVHVNMGFLGLKAFPAAVIGGFGSLPGAIVGGITIGLVEAFAGFYLPEGAKDIAAYVVVLLMLMIKPTGIFGETQRKKV
jgi:branched-chain amino acid transport system permease protein